MTARNRRQSQVLFDDLRASLIQMLGEEAGEAAYKLIIDQLGGMRVSVPDIREYSKLRRNERIRRAFRDTSDVTSLADRFGLSAMTIYRVVRK